MRDSSSKEITTLAKIAASMADEFNEVRLVYLHGSVLKGLATKHSDVDLAVVVGGDENDLIGLQLTYNDFFELRLKNREVDLKVINAAPLAFKFSVVQRGSVIFSRSEKFRTDFEVDVIKKYLDFKYYYDSYNRFFMKKLAEEGRF
jgi:predicted nucleotidyltransferase